MGLPWTLKILLKQQSISLTNWYNNLYYKKHWETVMGQNHKSDIDTNRNSD